MLLMRMHTVKKKLAPHEVAPTECTPDWKFSCDQIKGWCEMEVTSADHSQISQP
jgi:hypothetical protein